MFLCAYGARPKYFAFICAHLRSFADLINLLKHTPATPGQSAAAPAPVL
jgi:hypothetical protein